MFAVHPLAINDDIEHTAPAADQLRRYAKCLIQSGSETRRLGLVVSRPAVGNLDLHTTASSTRLENTLPEPQQPRILSRPSITLGREP